MACCGVKKVFSHHLLIDTPFHSLLLSFGFLLLPFSKFFVALKFLPPVVPAADILEDMLAHVVANNVFKVSVTLALFVATKLQQWSANVGNRSRGRGVDDLRGERRGGGGGVRP